jgi:hypothetical protein
MTAKIRIRRKRILPQQQILDIRNAIYYLQGELGIDRARIGVWGTGFSGGHVVVVAASDSRIKAAVAHAPMLEGKDAPRTATMLSPELLQAEQRRARTGHLAGPNGTAAATGLETRLALAEYHPFWSVEQIPQATAMLFVINEKDSRAANEAAIAASKLLRGPTNVVRTNGPRAVDSSVNAAADWFLKHLGVSESGK